LWQTFLCALRSLLRKSRLNVALWLGDFNAAKNLAVHGRPSCRCGRPGGVLPLIAADNRLAVTRRAAVGSFALNAVV